MLLLIAMISGVLACEPPTANRSEAETLARLEWFVPAGPGETDTHTWIGRPRVRFGDTRTDERIFHDAIAFARCQLDNVSPTSTEPRKQEQDGVRPTALELRRRPQGHRVETRVSHESFGAGVPAARLVNLSTSFQVENEWRVVAYGQRQWKFGRVESRAGGGAAWTPRPNLEFQAEALGGPGNEILPAFEGSGRVGWWRGRTEVTTTVRHLRFRFPNTAVWVVAPELTFWFNDRLALSGRYKRRLMDYARVNGRATDDSLRIRSHVQVRSRMWLDGGYARGIETFDELAPEQLGRYQAHTALAGGRIDLPWLTSLNVTSEYQWRTTGLRVMQISVALAHGF